MVAVVCTEMEAPFNKKIISLELIALMEIKAHF